MIINPHLTSGYQNISLLITEGDRYSIDDAISGGVPIIGIPFSAESEKVLKQYLQYGIGKLLSLTNLTVEILNETIYEVTNNPVYKANVIELNKTLSERPVNGLQTAAWWIEYAIRNDGGGQMKNRINTIPLYQYYFLDVISVLLLVVSLIIYIPYKILAYIVRKIIGRKRKDQKHKEKKLK